MRFWSMIDDFYRNRPKNAGLRWQFSRCTFAAKKPMFNLNESNRIVMAQHPTDMRKGVNTLCGQVR